MVTYGHFTLLFLLMPRVQSITSLKTAGNLLNSTLPGKTGFSLTILHLPETEQPPRNVQKKRTTSQHFVFHETLCLQTCNAFHLVFNDVVLYANEGFLAG